MQAQRVSTISSSLNDPLAAPKAERIARAKAQIGSSDSPFYRFDYAKDFTREELVECLIATTPRFAFAHAANLAELRLPHDDRLALWRLLATQDENTPHAFHESIPASGPTDTPLTHAECYEIASLMVSSGHNICEYLPRFGLTRAQEWQLAQGMAASGHVGSVYKLRDHFQLDDKRTTRIKALGTKREIYSAHIPVQNERRQRVAAQIALRNVSVDTWLSWGRNFSEFGTAEADVIVPHLVARAPLQSVMKYSGVPELAAIADMPTDALKSQLATYAEAHPTRIHPAAVQLAWDTVQRNEVGCVLVRYAMQLFERHGTMPNHSRDVLSQTTGLPLERTNKLSQETANEVYSYLTDMQPRIAESLFAGVTFAPELLANKRLPEIKALLLVARDNFMLTGGSDASWSTLKQTFLPAHLTAANIGSVSAAIEADTVRRIGTMFEADGITADGIRNITQRWGTLETFLTLVARFNGNENWRDCVPTLGRILSAEASESFAAYKLGGFPGDEADQRQAAAQLAVLDTPQQRAAWQTARCRALVDDGGTALAEDARWQRINEQYYTTLCCHLPSPHTDAGWIAPTHAACESTGDIRPVFAALAGDHPSIDVISALKDALAHAICSPVHSFPKVRRALTLMQMAIDREPGCLGEIEQQVRNDITSLMVNMKASAERRESIVVTALVNDARTLLEVGDIVRTSSCQNYKTGSHANNLPGYVIDANVQAIVSFAPGVDDFASRADYDAAMADVRAGTARVDFEPCKRTIAFTLADGREIRTRSIPYAYLRSVLKLGVTESGAPGLFLERPYLQSHSAEVAMDEAHEALMQEVADEIGARTHVPMTCKQTRNPGGIYSDAAGGAQKRDYRVG